MAGLMVFTKLTDALQAGFQVYDKMSDGYLMRKMTPGGWAMALVRCKS